MLLPAADFTLRGSRPSQNVEIVRQAINAYERREVEAMRRLMSPDVVLDWTASSGWLANVYRGFEEVLRVFADNFSTFETIVIQAEAYIPHGDLVVVPNVSRHRGREGIEVSARATFVYTLRDETITRICLYQELADALEAMDLAA